MTLKSVAGGYLFQSRDNGHVGRGDLVEAPEADIAEYGRQRTHLATESRQRTRASADRQRRRGRGIISGR